MTSSFPWTVALFNFFSIRGFCLQCEIVNIPLGRTFRPECKEGYLAMFIYYKTRESFTIFFYGLCTFQTSPLPQIRISQLNPIQFMASWRNLVDFFYEQVAPRNDSWTALSHCLPNLTVLPTLSSMARTAEAILTTTLAPEYFHVHCNSSLILREVLSSLSNLCNVKYC